MVKFDYDQWIAEHAEAIGSAVNHYAMSGIYDEVVFVFPSRGKSAGFLVVGLPREAPKGRLGPAHCDIVRFPGVGDRVSSVPRPQLYDALWRACRSFPICPTE